MKVITIATDLDHPFLRRMLIPSCATVGLDLVILHPSKPGFRLCDKRMILTEYLARPAVRDDLVLFTDAYDTLFLRGEPYIREAYAAFPHSVVFSGELNSWPLGAIGFLLQQSPPTRPYPYLNSGGFIGPPSELLALCAKYPTPPSDQFPLLAQLRQHDYEPDELFGPSDQYYWTLVRLLEAETIGVDYCATLFEYLGPQYVDVWNPQKVLRMADFRDRGRDSPSYGQERARLLQRLHSPSTAAQVHFASPITKEVALDLLDEGMLPAWLGKFGERAGVGDAHSHVERIDF
ncbi:hypothetical protein RB614_15620 [Phytohabitans sp. ZYX-F-186]|uniref:PLOD1-3-like GT domain-containing protein n=1 Tax=Phytohabitans maris TaxID=3071409 RepID=A0ABU0ZFV4_9ACTN|nr:hypothetical protein [Phytohabitans sp. ZYX-F-186]MDQ7905941.1 hypothetical protein [Phytohabitans sp. ZYX-F-186]